MSIQDTIDNLPSGGVLRFDLPKEIQGPLHLRKPVTIEGNGASFWAPRGPVVIVESDGVILRNLNVSITEDVDLASGVESMAIVINGKFSPTFEDVTVRGNVHGLVEEAGTWEYPQALRLRSLKAGERHTFVVRIVVPVDCRIRSDIAGIHVEPNNVRPGLNEVRLVVDQLRPGTRLRGDIVISSAYLHRRIPVIGNSPLKETEKVLIGSGQCLFEAKLATDAHRRQSADREISTEAPPEPPRKPRTGPAKKVPQIPVEPRRPFPWKTPNPEDFSESVFSKSNLGNPHERLETANSDNVRESGTSGTPASTAFDANPAGQQAHRERRAGRGAITSDSAFSPPVKDVPRKPAEPQENSSVETAAPPANKAPKNKAKRTTEPKTSEVNPPSKGRRVKRRRSAGEQLNGLFGEGREEEKNDT